MLDIAGSIVLYNTQPAEVENAVRQFLAIPLRAHLWVIDNSPTPVRFDCPEPARVTRLYPGANVGYGTAHNLAIRAAAGKALCSLVMNTDITFEPEVGVRLFEYIAARADVGLVAPRITYPDGRLQYVCRLLPHPGNLFVRRFMPGSAIARRSDERYELRGWDHLGEANLPYFQGSFLLMRTELANRIGGFDERFFLYGEDIDLCRRLHAVSRTMYVPSCVITHEYRRFSNRGFRGTWIGIQNNMRYFSKWGWFHDPERKRVNASVLQALRLE